MKLLIIGSAKSWESQEIKNQAEKRGHLVKIIPLRKLIISGQDQLSILDPQGQEIKEFEAVLFRAINQHITEAKIVAQHLAQAGCLVVDRILAQGNYLYDKFFMHHCLWTQSIPQPPSCRPLSLKSLRKILDQDWLKPPLLIKHLKEMHGRFLYYFNSQEAVWDFFKKDPKRLNLYFVQQWYPSEYYYRTVVLGQQVLGAIKRLALFSSQRPQPPLSQRSSKAELFPELEELSLKASQALGIELAGLDIIPDPQGQLKVLEVNRSPRFKRFSHLTGLSLAEEIIKYLEEQLGLIS